MLDPANLTVTLGERTAVLTRREFGVFSLLQEANGATVAHETLLGEVWGPSTPRANLRVAIAGLRRKLEADPELPMLFLVVPGEGYRLVQTAFVALARLERARLATLDFEWDETSVSI